MKTTPLLTIAILYMYLNTVQGEEICYNEEYAARCPDGDVIVPSPAFLGRRRPGRCIATGADLGCGVDVTSYIGKQCLGRQECRLAVASLEGVMASTGGASKYRACTSDHRKYLEAGSTCAKGVRSGNCRLIVADAPSSGLVTNRQLETSSLLSRGCPATFRLRPNQQLKITLRDYTLGGIESTVYSTCQVKIAIAYTHANRTMNVAICRKSNVLGMPVTLWSWTPTVPTEVQVYLTRTHTPMDRVLYAVQYTVRPAPQDCGAHTLPTGYTSKLKDGVLYVTCARGSTTATTTTPTWLLACKDGKWVGAIGECGQSVNSTVHITNITYPTHPRHIALFVSLGALAGITLVVVTLLACRCYRRRATPATGGAVLAGQGHTNPSYGQSGDVTAEAASAELAYPTKDDPPPSYS